MNPRPYQLFLDHPGPIYVHLNEYNLGGRKSQPKANPAPSLNAEAVLHGDYLRHQMQRQIGAVTVRRIDEWNVGHVNVCIMYGSFNVGS